MPAGRGRPKSNAVVTHIYLRLTLREGEDDDLLQAFKGVPARRRAAFIKSAMRSGRLDTNLDSLPDDSELAESLGNFLS
jgi:hypothetical protein